MAKTIIVHWLESGISEPFTTVTAIYKKYNKNHLGISLRMLHEKDLSVPFKTDKCIISKTVKGTSAPTIGVNEKELKSDRNIQALKTAFNQSISLTEKRLKYEFSSKELIKTHLDLAASINNSDLKEVF